MTGHEGVMLLLGMAARCDDRDEWIDVRKSMGNLVSGRGQREERAEGVVCGVESWFHLLRGEAWWRICGAWGPWQLYLRV